MNSCTPNPNTSISTSIYLLSRDTLLPNYWAMHISRLELFVQFQILASQCLSRRIHFKKKKKFFFSHKRENQARNLLNVQKAVSFSIYKSQETWRSSIMHPLLFLISRGSCNCPSVVTSHLYSQFWGHPLDLWMIPLYCLCACTRSEGRMVSSVGITLCSVTGFLQPRSSVLILLFRLLWDSS